MEENRKHIARRTISTGGMAPGWDSYANRGVDIVDSDNYEYANEVERIANQTREQSTRAEDGSDLQKFFEGGLKNIDMGSFTFGLSEGASLMAVRRVGDKNNEIIKKTMTDMGYDDKKVEQLLQSVAEDNSKLKDLSDSLEKESAALETMKATLDGITDSSEWQYYAKKYNSKVNAFNKKVKEFQTLFSQTENKQNDYEDLMSAIEAAVDNGLTGGEKALLDAFANYSDALGSRANLSVAGKAGAGAEQSAEFMLDFFLTGGLEKASTKMATKLTTKHLLRKLGKEAVEQMTVKPARWAQFLSDAVVAAERTAIMFPRNLSAYGEQLAQMSGQDQFGRYNFDRTHLNAALNTALTQLPCKFKHVAYIVKRFKTV